MYSTTWCGHCRRLKRQMDEAGIDYREVDLDQHPEPGARIIRATGGFRTVPTVEIEGRLYVNPSLEQVKLALVAN
jgi:mycoredoxin